MNRDAMTLEGFQRHIRARYYDTDSARGTAATFLWFIEEVGELATALQRAAADADRTSQDAPANQAGSRENLEEEFADVLAWLCTLANINDVDLTEAVRKKYLTGEGPAGRK